jgi:hypothetical protein
VYNYLTITPVPLFILWEYFVDTFFTSKISWSQRKN